MNTLLITGATGFIGVNILEYIKTNFGNKFKIVLLSSCSNRNYITILHKNYTFTRDDFIEKGIKVIDIVLHIGAFTPKSKIEENDIERSTLNIVNTKYLLQNLPSIPSKFVFLSTLDVYGQVEGEIDESCETKPLSLYGWSKLYCEKMIESWSIENRVIIQILRVGHVYGRGEEAYKKIIPVTIERLKNDKKPQIFGTGEDRRSLLHVNDLCQFILNSINLNTYEGVINVCSSNSYSIKEIVETLLQISNKKLDIDFVGSNNSRIDYIFNSAKMNRLLGNEKISIQRGLTDEYFQ